MATVIASRYHNHRWIPWVMYGMATAISFSRVTTSAHFPSDVFLGAALGYTITRFEVLKPTVNSRVGAPRGRKARVPVQR